MAIFKVTRDGVEETIIQESSALPIKPDGKTKFYNIQRVVYYHKHWMPPCLINVKGKKYIDHSLDLGLPEKYLDFSGVFQTGGPGLENNKSMWMNSFGFNNDSQLKALLPNSYRDKIEKTNNQVWDNLDNPEILLTLFDDYNDGIC